MNVPKIEVQPAPGIVLVRVGRENIKKGSMVSVSRRGFLKPCRDGEHFIGTAISGLPRGKSVEFEPMTSRLAYPSISGVELSAISASFIPKEFVSEKILPRVKR